MAPRQPANPNDAVHSNGFDEKDAVLVEHVAEKLVRFGQQVGVTPEELISLLDTGISIRDLLAFLASRSSGAT